MTCPSRGHLHPCAARYTLTDKGDAAVQALRSGHCCPCACLCFCEGVEPLADLGCQTPCAAAVDKAR